MIEGTKQYTKLLDLMVFGCTHAIQPNYFISKYSFWSHQFGSCDHTIPLWFTSLCKSMILKNLWNRLFPCSNQSKYSIFIHELSCLTWKLPTHRTHCLNESIIWTYFCTPSLNEWYKWEIEYEYCLEKPKWQMNFLL